PPLDPKTSTLTVMGAVSVDVHPKYVASEPTVIALGTEYRCRVVAPACNTGSGLSAMPASPDAAHVRQSAANPTAQRVRFMVGSSSVRSEHRPGVGSASSGKRG